MKKLNLKFIYALALLLIAGCASNRTQIAELDTDGYDVQQQVRLATADWQQRGDYDAAVIRLEHLSQFSGGGFEQARLTALTLIHLEHGNRLAFLETANQLEGTIGSYEYVPPQTQHILTVSYAMLGKPSSELPGRGYDSNRVQAVYELLITDLSSVYHD